MSESSSDTESSCGWTIISNEGSDIETLGPENGADGTLDGTISPAGVKQEAQQAFSVECDDEKTELSLDSTLKEETSEEAQPVKQVAAEGTAGSSSDHSDIVTLEAPRVVEEEEQASVEEEAEDTEEMYMGSASSSQYTFSTSEPPYLMSHWLLHERLRGLGQRLEWHLFGRLSPPVFPAAPPAGDSTSSEDEAGEQPNPSLRRRRARRSTASVSEVEEIQPSLQQDGEDEDEEEQDEELQEEPLAASPRNHGSSTLNKCILLALVVAISMGFGHFYGTVQIQERHRLVEKSKLTDQLDVRGDLHLCQKEQDAIEENEGLIQLLREDLEEKRGMVHSLTGIMDKITKENEQLRVRQAQLQVQSKEITDQLRQKIEEKSEVETHHHSLVTENQQLRNSLEREEESVSTLQEELRYLRGQIRNIEEKEVVADSVLSENQRLKDHLEEERQRVRSFLTQKETLVAEAQMLRRELDKERRVTHQLKEEVEQLSSREGMAVDGEADVETEELQARLVELEKKLNFEQQRSDLWERLYVETKEERSKGDNQKRVEKPKDTVMNKVKETFDAVKNSTKEFVHHHKEQIKKAKEAVKENLRKFSDSVKSTFRHFKDSATDVFEKARRPFQRRFYERKESQAEHCQKRQEFSGEFKTKTPEGAFWCQKPQHTRKFTDSTNTRKPGPHVRGPEQESTQGSAKGCSGVFDCAYQESMSLFNKALEPIRADEFNQLLHSYLQQEVDHFHHWRELENFINGFFHNGVFIHDQMLFTDFVSGVEDYLEDMDEYQRYDDDVFEDLDDYIYRHFFGDTYSKQYGPSRPFQRPDSKNKDDGQSQPRYRQQQKPPGAQHRHQAERKWNRPGRTAGRHVANVKIELGPMPFDPKY